MPEQNGKLDAVKVTRNDVELVFEPAKIKRGDKKGSEYLGLKVVDENYEQVGKWLGKDILVSMYRGKVNQRLQSLFDEACTQIVDGKEVAKPFDLEEFIELAKSFSARGETMEDIKNEIEDLTDELSNLDWSTGAVAAGRAQEIAEKIKSLRIARESKRRNREEKKPAEATA